MNESAERINEALVSQSNRGKLGLGEGFSEADQNLALKWAALASYLPNDTESIEESFVRHVEYSLAQTRTNLTPYWSFKACALSVRDRLLERWKDTQTYFHEKDCKRVAYLSLEFLIGRSLQNSILNMQLEEPFKKAMFNLGQDLENTYDQERDAGLGNGGLGRLAACFMDSLATLDYPAWGYGLRYNYGMFHQKIKNGEQIELPDYWLYNGGPWEIERLDVVQPVRFYGHVVETKNDDGSVSFSWEGGEDVLAVAYDVPIPGYDTFNTLNIRLWSAAPSREFDLDNFNQGNFYKSVEERQKAEAITYVLYPNDNTDKGKELRLKQQYFFVCATVADLVRRFKRKHTNFEDFPEKVAVQLNDTHPSLAIVELFRVLVDQEGYCFDDAWRIVSKTFSYTNHTVLPEALEKWSISLMEVLLPRHLQIIYQINLQFLQSVEQKWSGDIDRIRDMSIIQEKPYRAVRMANLAIVMSHTVNGVAELHSKLLVENVFPYFKEFYPDRFQNKTNGVTPRRWIHQANPGLSALFTRYLESNRWLLDLGELFNLEKFIDDEKFQQEWNDVKRQNKQRLADFIMKKLSIEVSPDVLFDIQVKRIHEYKRQLMNILYIIYRYRSLKQMTDSQKKETTPRVVFFGGKAAPGYYMAKKIIKLINNVADVVNNDPATSEYLKVIFIANYNVSKAEIIIPASDISQHISTAGMEASGTSNMKFVLNGGIIIGTLDGANIEIREEAGDDNMFIFGALTENVPSIREKIKSKEFSPSTAFNQALGMIETGLFGIPEQFSDLIGSITNGNDYYLVSYDFDSYIAAQEQIDISYKDKAKWTRMSILNSIRCAKFSSDRTIHQYAKEIWDVSPVRRPGPMPIPVESINSDNPRRHEISFELPSPATPHGLRGPAVVKKAPAKSIQTGFNL